MNKKKHVNLRIKLVSRGLIKKFAALISEKEVGYCTFRHPNDDSRKRNMELVFLWVEPSYRRRGVATKLMKAFLEKCRALKVVWVTFWTWDKAETDKTFLLYKKLGFKQLAYQSDYYRKGVGTRLFAQNVRTGGVEAP